MSQLHLPARHTDEDLALAGSLAQLLNSGELFVAWSTDGGAAKPVIPATVHAHESQPIAELPPVQAPAPAPEAPMIVAADIRPQRRGGLLQRLRARRRR